MPARHAHLALLVLLTITAGCGTTGSPSSTATETPTIDAISETPPSTLSATPIDLASSGTPCDEAIWVEFWRLEEERFWRQDVVRVSYDIPSNASFLLVAFIDGTLYGVANENSTHERGVHVDGAELELETPLSREHVVQVVMYRDVDGNGRLDREVDTPCLDDDGVVRAGPKWIDFSRFG